MPTVTIDTNIWSDRPDDDLLAQARARGFAVTIVSTSERESGLIAAAGLDTIPEPGLWGEGGWGTSTWGGQTVVDYSDVDGTPCHGEIIDTVLGIISGGSTRRLDQTLNDAQLRQVRDSMIFCAHVRERRDIFVTDDVKGFVNYGRRELLEKMFSTRILTRAEFSDLLSGPARP